MSNQSSEDFPFAIEIESLTRSFRGKMALNGVDLRVPVGSVFGLVGLNGAGKTTLIRHLVGSFRAQSGTVQVLGMDPVADPVRVLSRIGYLSEGDPLPASMRVGELIDFARAIYRNWDDSYALQLLDLFGLTRTDRLRSLSKGLRARVGLLLGIAHRPELLILDEPSSGLDPLARLDILEAIIRTISEEGRTVLFSSHLLDEVDRVCDCVALIRNGRMIETSTVEQIEARYEEIVCRGDASEPPTIQKAFGWQSKGDEWSAVIDREATNAAPLTSQTSKILLRREITLERWFAARAGREGNANENVSHRQVAEVFDE